MKLWPVAVATSLLLAACSSNTINTGSTSGGGTTGAGSTTGGTTGSACTLPMGSCHSGSECCSGVCTPAGACSGLPVAPGSPCQSNANCDTGLCQMGSCQYSGFLPDGGLDCANYPGSPETWGVSVGQVFPEETLAGGAVPNFSTTAVADSTNQATWAPSFSFQELHAAACQGFRYAFIDISAVWCPHCNDEAGTLPKNYVPGWLAKGGVVFSILVQNGNQSAQTAATPADLENWLTMYGINYPMSLDTQQNMVSATSLNAWPANLIIRLKDMVVIDSVFGATDAFYQEFSNVLASCSQTSDCYAGATCDTSTGTCH